MIPAADLEQIRARASFEIDAVKERERVTDHDVAAFVDVVAAVGRRGRPLDPLRPHLLRRARHRPRASAPRGGARARGGRSASSPTCSPSARASSGTRSASGARTACTPSPRPSGSSWRASRSRASGAGDRLEHAFEQVAVGKLSGAVGTYSALDPERRGARSWSGSTCEPRAACRPRSCRATATRSW